MTKAVPIADFKGMERKRYMELETTDAKLTEAEFAAGWHFCHDWDGMLIHKDWPEMACCSCAEIKTEITAMTDTPQIEVPHMCDRHLYLLVHQTGYKETDPWRALVITAQIVLFQAISTDAKYQALLDGDMTKLSTLGCLACCKPDAFGLIVEAGKSHDLGQIKQLGERWVNEKGVS